MQTGGFPLLFIITSMTWSSWSHRSHEYWTQVSSSMYSSKHAQHWLSLLMSAVVSKKSLLGLLLWIWVYFPSSELEVVDNDGGTFSFADAVDFAVDCLAFCSAAFFAFSALSAAFWAFLQCLLPFSLLLLSFSFPLFLFSFFTFLLLQPSSSVFSLWLCLGRHPLLVSTLAVVTAQVVDLLDCLEVNGDTNFCRIFEWFDDVLFFPFAGKPLLGRGNVLVEMLLATDTTDDVIFSKFETGIGFKTGISAKFSTTELGVVDTTLLISSQFWYTGSQRSYLFSYRGINFSVVSSDNCLACSSLNVSIWDLYGKDCSRCNINTDWCRCDMYIDCSSCDVFQMWCGHRLYLICHGYVMLLYIRQHHHQVHISIAWIYIIHTSWTQKLN